MDWIWISYLLGKTNGLLADSATERSFENFRVSLWRVVANKRRIDYG